MRLNNLHNIFFLKNYNFFKKKSNKKIKQKRFSNDSLPRLVLTYVHTTHYQYFSKKLLINNCNLYIFNKLVYLNIKKFESFFSNYSQKNNFVILDSNYGSVFNLYSDMFHKKNLYTYKQVFFMKPKYMTFQNWNFYFSKISLKNKIGLVVVTDYFYFKNFIVNFYKFNIILCLVQPVDFHEIRSDYYLYSHSEFLNIHKFMYIQYINSLYYSSKLKNSLTYNKHYLYLLKKFLKFI